MNAFDNAPYAPFNSAIDTFSDFVNRQNEIYSAVISESLRCSLGPAFVQLKDHYDYLYQAELHPQIYEQLNQVIQRLADAFKMPSLEALTSSPVVLQNELSSQVLIDEVEGTLESIDASTILNEEGKMFFQELIQEIKSWIPSPITPKDVANALKILLFGLITYVLLPQLNSCSDSARIKQTYEVMQSIDAHLVELIDLHGKEPRPNETIFPPAYVATPTDSSNDGE